MRAYNDCGNSDPASDNGTAAQCFTISGRVYDECDKWGLSGKVLQLFAQSENMAVDTDTSESDGAYIFEDMISDRYSIRVAECNPDCEVYPEFQLNSNLVMNIKRICQPGGSPPIYTSVRSLGGNPIPKSFELGQNYPNPFNAGTEIPFVISTHMNVTLTIYDVLGREIVRVLDKVALEPGRWSAAWNGEDQFGNPVPSGIYFYRLESQKYVVVRKMVLLK